MSIAKPVPTEFREDWLHNDFGRWQQEFRRGSGVSLKLEMSEVEWIDPLPMLTLILELAKCIRNGTLSNVVFALGERGTAPASKQRSRARKYLVLHRFIELISESLGEHAAFMFTPYDVSIHYAANNPQDVKRLSTALTLDRDIVLAYGDRALIPPRIVTLNNWESVVSVAVKDMDDAYFKLSKTRRHQRDTILQRTREVLFELIRNTAEHALNSSTDGNAPIVAVYARLRPQFSNAESVNAAREIGKLIDGHLLPTANWIELYVGDVGGGASDAKFQGIFTHAARWKDDQRLSEADRNTLTKALHSNQPENNLATFLFSHPVSRHERSLGTSASMQRGQVTGLRYLDSILARHNDTSCLYSGRICRYDEHPFCGTRGRHSVGKDEPFLGTAIRVCLRLSEPTELPDHWITPLRNDLFRNRVIELFSLRTTSHKTGKVTVLDYRTQDQETDILRATTAETFIARLPRQYDKNRCTQLISNWLLHIGNLDVGLESATLVLADLSRAQARNIESILPLNLNDAEGISTSPYFTRLKLNPKIFPKFASIIIITEDLACLSIAVSIAFQPVNEQYGVQFSLRQAAPRKPAQMESRLAEDVGRTLLELKHIDSLVFWKRVRELNQEGHTCLWGPVQWSETIRQEYLNFHFAMQDATLARALRRSLRRILALYPKSEVSCMDSLIEPEVRDAAKWLDDTVTLSRQNRESKQFELRNLDHHNQGRILVGSICFSGETLARHLDSDLSQISAVLEAFILPKASGGAGGGNLKMPHVSVMEWHTECTEGQQDLFVPTFDAPIQFEREPGTAFIRPIGEEKKASILSFLNIGSPGSSQTPHDMYAQFISDGVLKTGHWHYGRNHSLIEVNLAKSLQNYMVSQHGYYEWLKSTLDAYFIDGMEDESLKYRVVVYPLHRLSSLVVRYFRVFLDEEARNLYKFVPLHMLDGVGGGISKLARLSVLELEKYVSPTQAGNTAIAVFDIGFISKRTLRYIRRQLKPQGFKKIKAFGMMNRSSAPAFQEEEDGHSVTTYWRWNVPILGRQEQCSVCTALRNLQHIYQPISHHHPELSGTIKQVLEHWNVSSMEDAWHDQGLEPRRLLQPYQAKFGFADIAINDTFKHEDKKRQVELEVEGRVDRDADEETGKKNKKNNKFWHYVQHDHSTALVAHYVEIARYTGNTECLLNALEKENLFCPIAAVEVISTFITLCGKGMNAVDTARYHTALVHAVLQLDARLNSHPDSVPEEWPELAAKVLGLAVLVALGVDDQTHARIFSDVHAALMTVANSAPEVHNPGQILASKGAKLFFMVVLSGYVRRANYPEIQQEFIRANQLSDANAASFRALVGYLTLTDVHPAKLWRDLELWLGRGGAYAGHIPHDGRALSCITEAQALGAPQKAIETIDTLVALFRSEDGGFFEAINIHESIAEELEELLNNGNDIDYVRLNVVIDELRRKFREHLVRCDVEGSHTDVTIRHALQKFVHIDRFSGDIAPIRFSSPGNAWAVTNYVPWCARAQEEIKKHIENAIRCGKPSAYFALDDIAKAKLWISIDQSKHSLSLKLYNATEQCGEKKTEDITPEFLRNIGGKVFSSCQRKDDKQFWYMCDITIPWLTSVINRSDIMRQFV